MSKIYSKRLRQLRLELTTRYDKLIFELKGNESMHLGSDVTVIDSLALSMAIADFTTILKELKKIC